MRARGKDRNGRQKWLYIATTLTDAKGYPPKEIALLYAQRWKIEVKFRDIKTTMKLEMIRGKKPEMARKSVRMAFIAFNLSKSPQMDAIPGQPYLIDEIGFKGTLDVVTEFRSQFHSLRNKPRLLAARRKALGQ